jgi:nitronate monooxygenase
LEKNATVTLRTRLTEKLNITHPVLLAPMGSVSGGRLAGAVSEAGGLGLIGGGYGDRDWLEGEFAAAGNRRVGCGFITWSLAKQPGLLDAALAHRPAVLMLSFGDPQPFARRIRAVGVVLMCQVQSRDHTLQALDAGAEIIVAQGTEAGGHGGSRATLPLVPAIVDLVARRVARGGSGRRRRYCRRARACSRARARRRRRIGRLALLCMRRVARPRQSQSARRRCVGR